MRTGILFTGLVLCCVRLARAEQAGDLDVLHVQGNVYMIAGAGGNIVVQIGDMGVVVVDTGLEQNTDKVLAAIRKLSDKPIQYIMNTHMHPDHIGGNDASCARPA